VTLVRRGRSSNITIPPGLFFWRPVERLTAASTVLGRRFFAGGTPFDPVSATGTRPPRERVLSSTVLTTVGLRGDLRLVRLGRGIWRVMSRATRGCAFRLVLIPGLLVDSDSCGGIDGLKKRGRGGAGGPSRSGVEASSHATGASSRNRGVRRASDPHGRTDRSATVMCSRVPRVVQVPGEFFKVGLGPG